MARNNNNKSTNNQSDKANRTSSRKATDSTKKTTKRKKKKQVISHIVKPEKMSLEEWQIKLRKQVTDIEHFNISCVDDDLLPGEYIVRNPEKNNEYKVVYRGANSEWNYCSCMTRHLQTYRSRQEMVWRKEGCACTPGIATLYFSLSLLSR